MRLIDADALKSLLIETLENIAKKPAMDAQEMHIIAGCHMLCEMIDDAETVDAEPVRHERWIPNSIETHWKCSECGEPAPDDKDEDCEYLSWYCPGCGAKMDGGKEE